MSGFEAVPSCSCCASNAYVKRIAVDSTSAHIIRLNEFGERRIGICVNCNVYIYSRIGMSIRDWSDIDKVYGKHQLPVCATCSNKENVKAVIYGPLSHKKEVYINAGYAVYGGVETASTDGSEARAICVDCNVFVYDQIIDCQVS